MATVTGGLHGTVSADTVVKAVGKATAGHLSLASITDTASAGFSGTPAGGETAVAAQTQSGSNTVLHLHDGSTITVIGTTHIDASFFH